MTLCFGLFVATAATASGTPTLIGEFNDWSAFFYKEGNNLVCYMASTPKKSEGKYTTRGDVFAVVTHRPGDKSFDVVNFVAGYTFQSGANVVVKIGKTTISSLFVDKDKAWAINEKTDKELVAAMRAGERMIVDGVSSRGTTTKDTYSLTGFNAAYKAISAKCKR